MFETLFTSPAALSRHRNGPFAEERAAYLRQLASAGLAHGTLAAISHHRHDNRFV